MQTYTRSDMKIVVIQRGKLKDGFALSCRDEYQKRFRRYGELTILERPEKEVGSLFPDSKGLRVLLDEAGKTYRSEELARALEKWSMQHGTVAIAIGSAYGHNEATIAAAQAKLSLGPLTLPHVLAHVVLIEQIYRAATILRGEPYHHA